MQDIKDYLSYDPLTGLFTWIKNTGNKHKVNKVAGHKATHGYVYIQYKTKPYLAHRLAWYFSYGYMPDCDIDHKNEIKDDNRLENLRLDTNGDNEQNNSSCKSFSNIINWSTICCMSTLCCSSCITSFTLRCASWA